MMKDLEVKVNFWDLSGHPEFFEVRNEFYKDSQGVSAIRWCERILIVLCHLGNPRL